jgi:hypothetical protein
MQQQSIPHLGSRIPKDAVLLIPEPECASEKPIYGIKPGYYARAQMLELLERHQYNADAIHFIADMLETGDAKSDGFVEMLRRNCADPLIIGQIVKNCAFD